MKSVVSGRYSDVWSSQAPDCSIKVPQNSITLLHIKPIRLALVYTRDLCTPALNRRMDNITLMRGGFITFIVRVIKSERVRWEKHVACIQ
jgi:hypothetical protein